MITPVLDIDGLSVVYETDHGPVTALDHVRLLVNPGEILGLIGETGCGKSTLVRAIFGILPRNRARITKGHVLLNGIDMLGNDKRARHARGRHITLVPQDTFASLNPLFRIGTQVIDFIKSAAFGDRLMPLVGGRAKYQTVALEMLEAVQLPGARDILLQYPHQLSGGQRQRVMLAMALYSRPQIIIADEPTAALDAPIQAQILALLRRIAREKRVAILFTTHNLGAAWEICDRIIVMHGGRVIESAPRETFFDQSLHPYTKQLIESSKSPNRAPRWVTGDVVDPLPRNHCQFSSKCPRASKLCAELQPVLVEHIAGHSVACHNPATTRDRTVNE
ncbi:ABC transporter ATP-binding protein [Rhizobium calliandrae]|uniref:Nickel import system ATP-binding protein NikD n=1 Tax=Rhizobium calliandrae TaxID=1312182 RepID=A0ABT7KGM3_9HYPH|nr:ABC transporter ATP-binding protein [Rhizobium calliandrae]MDL2407775.1 ABC transporter ATP-binding protein [Rhizobium calliandrae]